MQLCKVITYYFKQRLWTMMSITQIITSIEPIVIYIRQSGCIAIAIFIVVWIWFIVWISTSYLVDASDATISFFFLSVDRCWWCCYDEWFGIYCRGATWKNDNENHCKCQYSGHGWYRLLLSVEDVCCGDGGHRSRGVIARLDGCIDI